MVIGTEIKDKICFIEMQDAKHLNCLSEELCTEMREALDNAYKNECVGVVIKSQINHGVWSAGHNIKELPTDGHGYGETAT